MQKAKTIAVVTGSRAEYGILKPLFSGIEHASGLRLRLYVTGMHLLRKYGSTVNDIKKDGFTVRAQIPMYSGKDAECEYTSKALARGIEGFTKVFSKDAPDVVLVFGDRFEALAAALTAGILHIPIGHIHGGDKTDSGHIDESTRHAITRYAHIHFAPTNIAALRLRRMGEQPFRIFQVGSLNIDSILETPKLTRYQLCGKLGLDEKDKIMVYLFLPLPIESKNMGKHARVLCSVIRASKEQSVVIYPNNDNGSEAIIREIETLRGLPNVMIAKSIPHELYINLLRHAEVLVGNSSSGIIEAPTLKLPVVNIGSRNEGREHAANVLFVPPERKAIHRAIDQALYDTRFRASIKRSTNPYGSGGTAQRIIAILKQLDSDKLLHKKIIY